MYELTERDKMQILQKMNLSLMAIIECDDNMADFDDKTYGYADIFNPEGYVQCYCKTGKGIRQENVMRCPHCGNKLTPLLSPKKRVELEDKRQKRRNICMNMPSSTYKQQTLFYAKKKPDSEAGILIYNLSFKVDIKDDAELVTTWKINAIVDIEPGVSCSGYKMSRGKKVEVDVFKALNINSSYSKMRPEIYFEDSVNSIDFVLKNKKFNKYTAYMDLFNIIELNIPKDSFFMMYMCLYAAYPSVQLIIKMGMYKLATQLMEKMAKATERTELKEIVDSFSKLIRPDATNGTHAFNMPKTVVSDCLERSASLEEIIAWQDIFELDADNKVTYDAYYKATRHPFYANGYYAYRTLVDCMVFGYQPMETLNYIQKQKEKHNEKAHYRKSYVTDTYAQNFVDYLRMCDTMNIQPDKYPSDIKTAHDNLAAAYKAQEDIMTDAMIEAIGKAAEKYIPDTDEYKNGEYIIVLPKSSYDIVQEGQNMRNCVGSYLRRIADRESLVFFIRKRNEPQNSLITAEYRDSRITQLYYKNNRTVCEANLKKLANDYAHRLNAAKFETQRIR